MSKKKIIKLFFQFVTDDIVALFVLLSVNVSVIGNVIVTCKDW